MASNGNLMVFTGNANPALAQEVAKHLGIDLGRAHVGTFSDGEITVELLENVRGRDVFVLQSTSHPTNDSLMEVMLWLMRFAAHQLVELRLLSLTLAIHVKIAAHVQHV